MARKIFTTEQIIGMLREAEVRLSQGQTIGLICMSKQRRFTKEFETEAVRLAETSGRTQHEIAEDLGVGLST
jgi:transposase-like protein